MKRIHATCPILPESSLHFHMIRIQQGETLLHLRYIRETPRHYVAHSNGIMVGEWDSYKLALTHLYALVNQFGIVDCNFGDVNFREIDKNNWIIEPALGSQGKKALACLEAGLVWDGSNPNIERSKKYWLNKILFERQSLPRDWRNQVASITNRKIRNFVSEHCYEFWRTSIFLNDRYFSAVKFFDTAFDKGVLYAGNFQLASTIPDDELRREIKEKLMLFKLSSDFIDGGYYVNQSVDSSS